MSETNGHHNRHTDGSANMKILSEDDHVVAFECHCGKEFIWAATSEDRPECPQCGCAYYANSTEDKQAQREQMRQSLPKPPATYKYFAAYLPDDSTSLETTHLTCVGVNLNIYDFMVWMSGAARERSADFKAVTIKELSEDEFLDLSLEMTERRRKGAVSGIIGIIGKLFGGIVDVDSGDAEATE